MSAKQRKIFWPLLVISCVTVIALAVGSARSSRSAESVAKVVRSPQASGTSVDAIKLGVTAMSSTTPQGTPLLGPAQMVRFTLYDAGIFPREARVSAGQVVIYIEDVSGNSAGLVVQNESSLTLGQVVRSQGQWRGSSRIALLPGRYEVFDASRPANRARLIVEP